MAAVMAAGAGAEVGPDSASEDPSQLERLLTRGMVATVMGPVEMILEPIEGLWFDTPLILGVWPRFRRGLVCGGALTASGIVTLMTAARSRKATDWVRQIPGCQPTWW